MTVLIVGSIGLDTIETPFGKKKDILGGSAIHASISASFHAKTAMIGVAGSDFPKEHFDFLKSKNIDVSGIQILPGETFRWSGYYEYDMNQAHTKDTKLNVISLFDPRVPDKLKDAEYVFLANLDPKLQLKVLDQLTKPKLVAMDTMNFWIETKREALEKVIKRADIVLMNDGEVRQFMETPNIPVAAAKLLKLGVKTVIIKKGEHGALLFSDGVHFSAPAYPQDILRDPTGAGDSFAGGFIGYLAKTGDISQANIRRAIIIGSTMASFNVEDFSLDRMKSLRPEEISARVEEFRRFTEF
ncbi:sugar kinase [candidate division WOR-1 bacterium RIFCSPLOWO2_02_FULL_46_20]|uniref:Sugar kinase n=2 Tax=Saganbacteria TaxID=1703751 RepID=A0A1F4R6Y5_UNCSA|nr:MAG: sugar kinase [candidate division WOR-1 bacterium RIFCSPHIGHO2_02_FULL_45_12]OGC03203.1 MAG: sugar kinase [candidate division WOR-1 bacterium RIFCSPLOWO2_02_FULL_46_20]OGC09845.1 MAG: sugar kinase [candidate division WOR-1 bacterium RIFCSPLOWO2_12_FULL_45_9]